MVSDCRNLCVVTLKTMKFSIVNESKSKIIVIFLGKYVRQVKFMKCLGGVTTRGSHFFGNSSSHRNPVGWDQNTGLGWDMKKFNVIGNTEHSLDCECVRVQ